jgi:hemerythrin superfamily protein
MATTDIFDRLKADHDTHRTLLAEIVASGTAPQRRLDAFEEFTIEVKAHAAAEEQALYSTMMRKPETTSETRHSVAEHHEIEEALNDIAATDSDSAEWMDKVKDLKHDYLHHIDEEEEEHFPDFSTYLTKADEQHMREVFDRRKKAEAREAEVTPEAREEAKD